MKISKPIKANGSWRILRHDGVKVGYYATKELAQRDINQNGWFE